MLLFNHDKFQSVYKNAPEHGSMHDVNKMDKLFTELGFEVRVYQNLTKAQEYFPKAKLLKNISKFPFLTASHKEKK